MALSFGKGKGSSSSRSAPLFSNTGRSSWRYGAGSGYGELTLDPSINRLQDEALGKFAGIYGDIGQSTDRFLNQSSSLRSRFLGNEGAYMNARVNPIRERFGNLRAQVQQDLGRRGLSGSSFMTGSLRDIDTQAGIQEGDARALAINEAAQFENQLNTQELEALNQAAANRARVTGETLEIARARLAQEMGILSLGTNQQGSQSGTQWGAKANLWGPPTGGSVPTIF